MMDEIYKALDDLLDYARKYWWQILAVFGIGIILTFYLVIQKVLIK